MQTTRALAGLLAALALLAGCGDGGSETHLVRGQVVRLADGGRQLVVDHEAIPDRMDAMRMTLPLQDPEQARGLGAGDKIRFELHVSRGRGSIGAIERLPEKEPLTLAVP